MATSKSTQTFNTQELVEAIMLETIDENDTATTVKTLLRCRRVSKAFKGAIDGSLDLRRAQWLVRPCIGQPNAQGVNPYVVATNGMPRQLNVGRTVKVSCHDMGGTARFFVFAFSGTQEPQIPTGIWGNMFAFPQLQVNANDKTLSDVEVTWEKGPKVKYFRQITVPNANLLDKTFGQLIEMAMRGPTQERPYHA